MEDKLTSGDILGLKPVANAVEHVVKKTTDGLGVILSKLLLPGAEEIGLLAQERIGAFRRKNLEQVGEKVESILESQEHECPVYACPRLISKVIDESSWISDSALQDMWAGLLASGCSESGNDDSNIRYVGILEDLTKNEALVLDYICEHAEKVCINGITFAKPLVIPPGKLVEICSYASTDEIALILDRLEAKGLTGGTISPLDGHPEVMPIPVYVTPLGVNLYVRCKGSRKSAAEFFNLTDITESNDYVEAALAKRAEGKARREGEIEAHDWVNELLNIESEEPIPIDDYLS